MTRKFIIIIVLVWTVVIGVSLLRSYLDANEDASNAARTEARAAFNKDMVYRRWVASHGGVYVPVTEQTPPNPYLNAPNRDVTTIEGVKLTLMNPAYMTRQALELGEARYGARGHLTSLNPIRPQNSADAWETAALQRFEQGETEISSIEMIDAKPFMRVMRPMMTEEHCLTCHADQGYKLGDVRGGISIDIPMEIYGDDMRAHMIPVILGHGAFWILGVFGIILGGQGIRRRTQERDKAEEKTRNAAEEWKATFDSITDMVSIHNEDFKINRVNRACTTTFRMKPHELIGKTCYEVFHGTDEPVPDCPHRLSLEDKRPHTLEFFEPRMGVYLEVSTSPIVNGNGKGGVAAGSVHVVKDISARKQAEAELHQSFEKLRSAIGDTIHAMSMTIETRDPYTAGHQRRVAQLASAIAKEMGLPEDQIDGIRVAGEIHDIGKIHVPAEILSKPAKLNELEFSLVKSHPQAGYDILEEIEFPWPIAQIVLQHHERMDGSGYPEGLSDGKVLIEARILAVADVVEAMVSHRPYRPALGTDKALEELAQNRGVLYDIEVVDACTRLFIAQGFKFEQGLVA